MRAFQNLTNLRRNASPAPASAPQTVAAFSCAHPYPSGWRNSSLYLEATDVGLELALEQTRSNAGQGKTHILANQLTGYRVQASPLYARPKAQLDCMSVRPLASASSDDLNLSVFGFFHINRDFGSRGVEVSRHGFS
jgi:hypothetical protein